MKKILIGVTGSISAYKVADIISLLKKDNYDIQVVMTQSATKFITPLTLQVMSQKKVLINTFDDNDTDKINHIELAMHSDIIAIIPATATFISKVANGIGDCMLTNIMLAVPENKKIIFAPAMNTNMYNNNFIQENIMRLKSKGFIELRPIKKTLPCGSSGIGALMEVDSICEEIKNHSKDL